MKKLLLPFFFIVGVIFSDQYAISDNGIKVILKDDSTWQAVDDVLPGIQVAPFATTEDSQVICLKADGKWEPLAPLQVAPLQEEVSLEDTNLSAITDNGLNVLLRDDGTWGLREKYDLYEYEKHIAPFATTNDNQRVLLTTEGWQYLTSEDSFPDAQYLIERKPKPIKSPIAKFPEEVRMAGIEGSVIVKSLVDTDGNVIETKIMKSSENALLDKAALKAAMKATFTPAEQFGKKVRVWVSRTYNFRFRD